MLAALALMLLLAVVAALPDPTSPTIVPLAAVVGGFVGAVIARARGASAERTREIVENWAFAVTGAALAVYLVALAADLY